MKYCVLMLDVLGLVAMCVFAATASAVFSLWKLLMAGFLKSALTISDMGLGIFSRLRLVKLQIVTRGAKTWITISMGKVTLGGAIEKTQYGEWDVSSDVSDRPTPQRDK